MVSSQQEPNLRNLLLRLSYDGTDFFGWQIQPQRPTIQGILADSLSRICCEPIDVCGSGRTDAGVHACAQAANFKTSSPIPCPNLKKAANNILPDSIRVLSVQQVPETFHARHHASSKIYRYRIFRGEICPPQLCRYVLPYPYPLDESAMLEAARYFQGSFDFRSFAAASDVEAEESRQEKSYVRTIYSSEFTRDGDEWSYTVEGNGFLRHMVRNIVGTLLDVGRGRMTPEKIPEIIAARQRSAAGPTAPARGLHLISVAYPDEILAVPLDKPNDAATIEERRPNG